LLPTGAREVPGLDLAAGYCSARELGGDFYDFLSYGKGRLAVSLAMFGQRHRSGAVRVASQSAPCANTSRSIRVLRRKC